MFWGVLVLLRFGSEENLEFGITAFDPPTRQYLGQHSDADDIPISEVGCSVPIDAARKQKFQKQSVLIKAAWSKYKSAMDKAAVAPEVAPGEQHDAYVLVVTISCSSSHPPPRQKTNVATTIAVAYTRRLERIQLLGTWTTLLNCSQTIAQLARYSVLRAGEGCASRPGQARSMGIFIQ